MYTTNKNTVDFNIITKKKLKKLQPRFFNGPVKVSKRAGSGSRARFFPLLVYRIF